MMATFILLIEKKKSKLEDFEPHKWLHLQGMSKNVISEGLPIKDAFYRKLLNSAWQIFVKAALLTLSAVSGRLELV